jgi:hypothetical protein
MWMDLRHLRIDSLRGATLTKAQYLLMKLAEEAVEVAQRCSKQSQFGPDEKQRDQEKTNAERLQAELLDLCAVWKLLEVIGEVPQIGKQQLQSAFANKKIKMQKYLDHSYSIGMLPKITL